MKKIIIFNICILYSLSAFSQKGNNQLFSEYEDTLKVIADRVMNLPFEAEKRIANNALIEYLTEVLSYEKSFNYHFDSLITISRIKSPDKRFRIFNWLLKKDNNTYEYYGIVHYYNKNKKKFELITLTDNSNNIRTPEQENLDASNWYGGIIYDIIYIKKPGKKYYTILLWDGNDGYSTKKIIDVMYFSGKKKIKFGLPIFKKNAKESQKRIIFQYDSKTTASVKYNYEKQEIIFNNLVPQRKGLEGLYEFYIPEGTFNSYKYKNGKWWFKEDVDARIKQKIKKYKKPKRGLSPN
ncbi:MAG: hypothetical protein HOD68_05940 [Flavobacteriales bacterium]|nr:hypothetical protein [Flavobacteriales bacterium]